MQYILISQRRLNFLSSLNTKIYPIQIIGIAKKFIVSKLLSLFLTICLYKKRNKKLCNDLTEIENLISSIY